MTGSAAVLYNVQRYCAYGWMPGARNDAGKMSGTVGTVWACRPGAVSWS